MLFRWLYNLLVEEESFVDSWLNECFLIFLYQIHTVQRAVAWESEDLGSSPSWVTTKVCELDQNPFPLWLQFLFFFPSKAMLLIFIFLITVSPTKLMTVMVPFPIQVYICIYTQNSAQNFRLSKLPNLDYDLKVKNWYLAVNASPYLWRNHKRFVLQKW